MSRATSGGQLVGAQRLVVITGPPRLGGASDGTHDAVDVDARGDDVLGVDAAERHQLVHLHDGGLAAAAMIGPKLRAVLR